MGSSNYDYICCKCMFREGKLYARDTKYTWPLPIVILCSGYGGREVLARRGSCSSYITAT